MQHSYNKIAVFGGTFDPIHLGHLLIAEQAYELLALDRVFFMPAGVPPHKDRKRITDSCHRLEMVKLAIEDNPHFSLSDYEINKKGSSYTADTLRYFLEAGLAQEIFFLIGADSLTEIYSWREPEYLLENGRFIVARRPDFPLSHLLEKPGYKEYSSHIHIMDSQLIDISSSGLREKISKGCSIRYQTRDEIIDYIKKEGLYRGD